MTDRVRIVDDCARVRVDSTEASLIYYLCVLRQHHGKRYARAGMIMEYTGLEYSQQLSRSVENINEYNEIVQSRSADDSIPGEIIDESGASIGRGAVNGERIFWLTETGYDFVRKNKEKISSVAMQEVSEETVVAAKEVENLKDEVRELRKKVDAMYEYFDVDTEPGIDVNVDVSSGEPEEVFEFE